MQDRRRSSSTFDQLWSTAADSLTTTRAERRSRLLQKGMSARSERRFNVASWVVIGLMAIGWSWSIANARDEVVPGVPTAAGILKSALTDSRAPSVAYLTGAALDFVSPLRGESGKLRAN